MNELVVIDFETTGLSPKNSRIIEVAAIKIDNNSNEILESFDTLMNPNQDIPYFITKINGITNQMVKDKPCPEEVMFKLKKFIGDRKCVAHNSDFDSRFYHAEMTRAALSHEKQFYCTLKLSKHFLKGVPHKLEFLTEHLQLAKPKGSSHRALYDAMITVELWKYLKQIIAGGLNEKKH